MVGESGGPVYHIWLYLCVFGWVCLVVCWWWRGARNMIDCIWPFGCIWVWLGMLVVFGCGCVCLVVYGCMLVVAWGEKYDWGKGRTIVPANGANT